MPGAADVVQAGLAGPDVAALVLGLIFGLLGICACIGWYAQRK